MGWKKILTEGDDGSSLTYSTSISDGVQAVASEDNFDIYTAADLKNKTFTELFDIFLFPTIEAYIQTAKSVVLTGVSPTGTREVGEALSFTLSAAFNRGVIYDGNGTPNANPLVGVASNYAFSGQGTSNPTNQIGNTLAITGNVQAGTNLWSVIVTHGAGAGDYYDNKENIGTNLDASRVAGTTSDNAPTITGVYPFFYGMSTNDLTSGGTGFYTDAGLTKLVAGKSTKTVTISGTNKYIYFGYPASYGDLVTIHDPNNFEQSDTFTKYTVDITSVGLGSNWTVTYNIYTNGALTETDGSWKFTF